jgi:hypothetical protein
MNRNLLVTALIATAAFGASFAASAQTNAASTTQRDVNQEQRIENGLQNGSITTRENSELQREEAHVDRMQARDMKDGAMSPAEKAKLTAAQDKVSRDITQAKTNGINGNPLSASSQRAQADVQRNVNQQQRINNGVRDGSLTNRQAAKLERGQSHVDAREARAGADGHIGANEQRRIQRADNRQSKRIYNKRHDGVTKG